MYRIEAVDSLESVQAFCSHDAHYPPMPSLGSWLDSNSLGFIALGPEGPVGAVLLTPCRQVANHVSKYRLDWLYVLPEHRNKGLGKRLAQTAATEALRRGASAILIPVKPENQDGISWSETLPKLAGIGFVISLDRCGF